MSHRAPRFRRAILVSAAAAVSALALSTASFTSSAAAAEPGPPARATSTVTCSVPTNWTNAERAFDNLVGRGLTTWQAAGVVGNFIVESGVDPHKQQCGGGPGRGIAQWTAGGRYGRWDTVANDNMLWYARVKQNGISPDRLSAQLNFTWYELTTFSYYGLADLRRATTIQAATRVFMDKFERPNPNYAHFDRRFEAAQQVFNKFA